MNNTTVNYTPSLPALTTSASPAALKQVAAQNTPAPETVQTNATAKPDQTSFSRTGGLIAKALSLSDVRHHKVAGLQKVINDGTYKVSSSDVASKLLKSLLR